jgi:hypothetical protein
MAEVTWRKMATVPYDTSVVEGDELAMSAKNPDSDEHFEVKKSVDNDGAFDVSFPLGHTGRCEWRVQGDKGGVDEGSFEIKSA